MSPDRLVAIGGHDRRGTSLQRWRLRLFPERHHHLVVAVEDQVDPVRVVDLALDPVRRPDRAISGRQTAAIDDAGAGLALPLFDELLADAILAVVGLELGLHI